MLRLEDYKALFIAVGLVGTLLLASPSLIVIMHLPSEKFSELWVLGPSHTTEDYPFNVKANETYKIFVGVANHMAFSSYYLINVKFKNQTDPLPTTEMQSPLPTLCKYHIIIQNGEVWETQLTFSFLNFSSFDNQCVVRTLKINNVTFIVDKPTLWNLNYTGYYYQLFFELWIYNTETEAFQFHNRFVYIWLNMTFSSIT